MKGNKDFQESGKHMGYDVWFRQRASLAFIGVDQQIQYLSAIRSRLFIGLAVSMSSRKLRK
jgi:hypothetical protein